MEALKASVFAGEAFLDHEADHLHPPAAPNRGLLVREMVHFVSVEN